MSRANEVIDGMISQRMVCHPNETWTREVPFFIQRAILGSGVTVAAESDDGRGSPVLDLYGRRAGGGVVADMAISVKTTAGRGRKTGRTAIFTTGTELHVSSIIRRMMEPTCSIVVLFAHYDETAERWVQTDFDAADVIRRMAVADGPGDYDGYSPAMVATGQRGIGVVVRTRQQTYKPRRGPEVVYTYDQIRFNMSPLIERGLVSDWREVAYPEIVWG